MLFNAEEGVEVVRYWAPLDRSLRTMALTFDVDAFRGHGCLGRNMIRLRSAKLCAAPSDADFHVRHDADNPPIALKIM